MIRRKIVGYVSEIDKMLKTFNQTQPKSESQLAEIQKYERVYKLRDEDTEKKKQEEAFEGF